MSESARTVVYGGVAVVSVIAAVMYGYMSQPGAVEGFETVGTEFYPDFNDPGEAASLKVAAFDEDTAAATTFVIEQREPGKWVIPTHWDYPADARDRLNKTANSIIGIVRGPQKARRESEYKDYGVIDPLSEDLAELEGRGKRITLKKADGTTLADYIIGKKVADEGNRYYVRIPRDPEVYIAEIDVDLSTKFSDWIEDDLLKLDRNDLREITVNKYSIDETRGVIGDQEVNVLTREKSFDPWVLKEMNEETEEVRTTEINSMVDAFDNLKIVGVRRKPKGLNPDLTVTREVAGNPLLQQAIIGELRSKGFFVLANQEGRPAIYANEGNVQAATSEGVVYTLNFGEIFSGSVAEIEIGSSEDNDEKEGDDKKSDEEKEEENAFDDNQSRYLFVTAAFDARHLGPKPTEPAKPVKPEGLIEEPANDDADKDDANKDEQGADKEAGENDCGFVQDEQEKSDENQESGEEKSEQKTADQDGKSQEPPAKQEAANTEAAQKNTDDPKPPALAAPKQETPPATQEPAETPEEKQARLKNEWEAAQRAYDAAMKTYATELKDYNKKVADAKKKVDDLNYRFGDWYYVISNDSFQTLRLSRTDLVKPKEAKDPSAGANNPLQIPGLGAPAIPGGGAPAGQPGIPPAAKKPANDEGAPGENKAPGGQDAGVAPEKGNEGANGKAAGEDKKTDPPTQGDEKSGAGEEKAGKQ